MANNYPSITSSIDIDKITFIESPTLPRASIVIVNTNELHHLKRCLPAICHQDYPDYEVIVVDNASTDGSQAYIEQTFPQVRIIKNLENLGYTGANNVGFKHASGAYIAVLNPDTQMEPDWLLQLVMALEDNPQAALVAGKVLLMDQPSIINSCGLDVTYTGLSFCRGLGESSDKYNEQQCVFGAAGSAFVIRRSVLEQVGGFDESFFIYYDDTDLALRVNLAGYTCLYVPTAVGSHNYVFKFSARKCFMQERNRYLSLFKTFRWPTLILFSPLLLISEIISWGYALLQGREHLLGKLKSSIWIITHWKQVLEARRQVQRLRRISDRKLLSRFTYRLNFTNTSSPLVASGLTILVNPLIFILGNILRSLVVW
ncbi:MAG: glycosyltransferase family 2 protein [Chloroflexi bacterium]|nr:glycosyltransferase family 2 protein [Chloroflexota bacterium]